MLQRMAEDVEFTDCLDHAAGESDSLKRIAYVAAFAMSNYSSTIGRIAKPFNPMLGETFEYVDLDKKYRYISEQVSHHPPISTCIAHSPAWAEGRQRAVRWLGQSFYTCCIRLPAPASPATPSPPRHHWRPMRDHPWRLLLPTQPPSATPSR